MRATASILHLDLDAFFAAVEQRDKPSLRGKAVIVGGVGNRGVVATASYEARVHGVRSAMSMAEARGRCPHAAFLTGRFEAYRASSRIVMDRLAVLSPLVEPLSLDEAFVDLAAGPDFDPAEVPVVVDRLLADITAATGGLTASVGVASSKLMAKIASEINKPDGVCIIEPGTELDVLRPLQITAIPGVGPVTAQRLRQASVTTVDDARALSADELVRVLGQSAGRGLFQMVRADDDRPVVADREAKSISIEDTFEVDVVDRDRLGRTVDRMAGSVAGKLVKGGLSGRTVTLKVRHHDFETHTRSATLAGPTDSPRTITATARRLLDAVDLRGGLRLIGVGVSGLADWVQDDLFDDPDETTDVATAPETTPQEPAAPAPTEYRPGMDVHHAQHGDGWVWGSGLGRVTVRFETRHTPPGPVRTFATDDPALAPAHPDTVET